MVPPRGSRLPHSFAFPKPPELPPPLPSPPRVHPATLHDLHLLASASCPPSDTASWAGDGTSLTGSSGRRRPASSGHGSMLHNGAMLREEPPAFWQHCLLVGLYNVCLDDDICQEVLPHDAKYTKAWQ